ncbi:homoserine O-acetyltransferase [Puccinia striiformis f. sp. tritici PST-78]|uniref:Homoserine O-acetyltransferase n=1 Tax=Puccinia striiformis f. sp. tritici PST-78 TaxID=1165861 RepID=A0A0L0VH44_9BASI|nr:homoserine O-acetyltransferase [Puccinia striiformis f. sp. tritici PST-78]
MQPEGTTISFPQTPPQTPFSHLIPNQNIAIVSQFKLSSGVILTDVPVAYRTWGELNAEGTNCMVICHALTGSADVEDWWGPLVGPGLVFDPTLYFIFCANALGSPYGSASPVSINPKNGKKWGPEFPSTTMRDDVNLQKILLDHFKVRTVSVVIGGSMGGMTCLEWPLCTPPGYVLHIVPIATCPRHSAWGISWGEAQRQSIYSDPKYLDGYYDQDDPPAIGLAAARMAALLTYRSRDSFESRFGRKQVLPKPDPSGSPINGHFHGTTTNPSTQQEQLIEKATLEALTAHNDGHRLQSQAIPTKHRDQATGNAPSELHAIKSPCQIFSAQSYLRYQGDKFVGRFDANCYIHLTRKLDSHDVDHGREDGPALLKIPPGALVVAINSDGLFTLVEQQELADSIPDAQLVVVESTDGHDGFLLEFEQINRHVLLHLRQRLPHLYGFLRKSNNNEALEVTPVASVEPKLLKTSICSEADGSITDW